MGIRGKRYIEKPPRKGIGTFVFRLVQLVLIGIIIYSGYKIAVWFIENRKTSELMDEVSSYIVVDDSKDDWNKYEIDFEKLKEKNKDVKAFLKVKGTDIEYPIVQGTDNSYYLTYSLDKSYNKAGWPFVDYRNKLDGNDKNIIIYGHNRRDGSMFESLKNTLTDEWFNNTENRKIIFITENEKSMYEVFSTYNIEAEDYYLQTQFNEKQNEFEDFINTIKKRSSKNFNVEVNKEDKILTLSTCANDNKYRVVLHAKKIENNVEDNKE